MSKLNAIAMVLAMLSTLGARPPEAVLTGTAHLRINSDPPGATVILNGVAGDVTPLTFSNLPPGEYLVVLHKPGFRAVRKTVTLAPDQRLALDLRLEPMYGLLLVVCDPPGAEVAVNDAARGAAPLLVTDLPLGRHRIRASAPGYQPKTTEIEIRDRTPVKLALTLISDSAALTIDSMPPGANVLVNGIAVGVTPCQVDRVEAGDCVLKLLLDGYRPYEQTFKLRAGQRESLTIRLEAIPATLKVVSIPDNARVYVDNQYRGQTPLEIMDLPPGSHRVRAELLGHEPLARDVILTAAATVVEEFRLEPNSGVLEIVTEPPGVTVFVDGQQAGVTAADSALATVSRPLVLGAIAAGERVVRLSKKGFDDFQTRVLVKKNETTPLRQKLQRRFAPDCEVRTPYGVERGMLVAVDEAGNVRLEVRPGVFKTIPAKDVQSRAVIGD